MDRPPNVSYVDPKSWIALIQRSGSKSNCTFDLKVYNAQQAGYSAVIVYNFGSDNLIKMSSSGLYSIKIPAVFVGESSGTEIKKYFTYHNKTYVRITSDDADLNYLIIPFVCVVSICFIVAIFIFVSIIF
jgi:E3 ubiquitin-protein ligase RNF13